MFNISFSSVIDYLGLIKDGAPYAIDGVIKIFEDIEALVDLIKPLTGTEEPLVNGVSGPFLHRRFKTIVKNIVIRKGVREHNKSFEEVEELYDAQVTTAMLISACAEVGIEPPAVGGNFKEWLESVDWKKVLEIAMKIFLAILPFLLLAPTPTVPVSAYTMSSVEQLKEFYTNNNNRLQSLSRLLVSGIEKHGSQVAVNLMNSDYDVASKMLVEFNK